MATISRLQYHSGTAQYNELIGSLVGNARWLQTDLTYSIKVAGWTDYEIAQLHKAIGYWNKYSPVKLSESTTDTADLYVFDFNDLNGQSWQTYPPFTPLGVAGAPWVDFKIDLNSDGIADLRIGETVYDIEGLRGWPMFGVDEGAGGFRTLMHEFGHLLGLAHPHDEGGESECMADGGSYSYYNPQSGELISGNYANVLDDVRFTIMSYNAKKVTVAPATPMVLDIAALQVMYGEAAAETGNNRYNLADVIDKSYKAIWDTAGIDEIYYNGAENITIDLRQATLKSNYANGSQGMTAGGFYSGLYDGNAYDNYGVELRGGYFIAGDAIDGGYQTLIENARGGSGNDHIVGNHVANLLIGNDGNDRIYSGDGNDRIYGGLGNDYIRSGNHDDFINGGSGNDNIAGGVGNDKLYGVDGNDWLYGDDGNDVLYGGSGNDYMRGGNHNDYLNGQDGDDKLYGDNGNDRLYGGNGKDYLYGGRGHDKLYGGNHDDYLNSHDGDDWLYGEDGNDVLYGGSGNDYMRGGNHNDYLNGQDGNDRLYGDNGNDRLQGGRGDDRLYGGYGNDRLYGEAGNDRLYGGYGHDSYFYGPNQGRDFIYEERNNGGFDTLYLDFDMDEFFARFEDADRDGRRDDLVLNFGGGNSVSIIDYAYGGEVERMIFDDGVIDVSDYLALNNINPF